MRRRVEAFRGEVLYRGEGRHAAAPLSTLSVRTVPEGLQPGGGAGGQTAGLSQASDQANRRADGRLGRKQRFMSAGNRTLGGGYRRGKDRVLSCAVRLT